MFFPNRAPNGLAINGDQDASPHPGEGSDKRTEGRFQFLSRHHLFHDPPKGVGVGKPGKRQVQRGPQHFAPTAHPVSNRAWMLCSSQFGQDEQHQQDIQTVADPTAVPLVGQRAEAFPQTVNIEHHHLRIFDGRTEHGCGRLHLGLLWTGAGRFATTTRPKRGHARIYAQCDGPSIGGQKPTNYLNVCLSGDFRKALLLIGTMVADDDLACDNRPW